MSLSDLLGTCGLAVLFALLLWVPGWCVSRAAGVRGWSALALAPGVTVALVAVATVVAQVLGWRWGTAALPVLGALTAMLTGLMAVLSRVPRAAASQLQDGGEAGSWSRGRSRPRAMARLHGPVLLAVLLSAVTWVAAYGWGAVSPRWPAQAFDAVFHLSAVAAVREGGDASLLGGLEALYQGQSVYYPTPWHAVVCLLPAGPAQATNAALLGTGALLWPGSLAGMLTGARDLLPGPRPAREWGIALAVLLGGGAVAFSVLLTSLAVWPYALSVVALPGVLLAVHLLVPAAGTVSAGPLGPVVLPGSQGDGLGPERGPWCRRPGRRALPLVLLLLVCTVGAVAAHGVAVFNVIVLGAGWFPAVWQVATARVRARGWVAAIAVAATLGGLWVVRRPLAGVLGYSRPDGGWAGLVATLGQALADLPAYGRVWGWTSLLGLVTASLTLLGAWLAWQQPTARSWLRAWVMALVLTVMVGGPSWWGRQLGAPWYLQKARLVPLVLLPALVLSALACSYLLTRLRTARQQRRLGGRDGGHLADRDGDRSGGRPGWLRAFRRVLPGAAAAVLVVVLAGGRLPLQRDLVASVHDPEQVQYGTLVTAREIGFIQEASSLLPPDAVVVGPPSRGASMLWALGGVQVVYPSRSRPLVHSSEHRLAEAWPGLEDGTGRQEVCGLLGELGAFYLYTDLSRDAEGARHGQPPYRWDVGFAQVPLEDIEPVASDGDYALWRITACD
ncbi:DUF6541 family protein [Actinomyces wuliandei]|uniref:DUF6541 family protein n=1 Tax=Actinomyces wuliandei TaxID=2057743 RepID=UPI000FDB2783|nr:DUF6541 family protein [Actinomyces wuliandei]